MKIRTRNPYEHPNFYELQKNDIPLIHEMQVSAFMPLLRKYKDYDSSPACETQERITEKFGEPTTPIS